MALCANGSVKTDKNGIYIPVDTCCHHQFCFALQMRHSCISLEQKQKLIFELTQIDVLIDELSLNISPRFLFIFVARNERISVSKNNPRL